jgi:hypothetical protein
MAYFVEKTEHNGAKNGGGHYGTRVEAKTASKVKRRQNSKNAAQRELAEMLAEDRAYGDRSKGRHHDYSDWN